MASSDSLIDKPQRGRPKRAELPDVNINTGAQSINTARASLCSPLQHPGPFTFQFPHTDPKICDPGWVLWNTMCYYFVNSSLSTQLTWHDARATCQRNRAELVSILSAAENSFVTSRIKRYVSTTVNTTIDKFDCPLPPPPSPPLSPPWL